MEQMSCLPSVISWLYIHILCNNLQVTSFWYYSAMNLRNSIMLRCWLSWSLFILNVLTLWVCVSRSLWWQDSEKCGLTGGFAVPLLAMYLDEQLLPLYSEVGLLGVVLPTGQWRFGKWKALYIYRCISCF